MSSTELEANTTLFTCLSCTIAFHSAEEQREHYRSDHHRYNMKRRVAGLPPVSSAIFNQKVLERRAETAVMVSPKGSTCEVCGKSYTTENAYKSHLSSRKHKENELKAISSPPPKSEPVHEETLVVAPAPVPEADAQAASSKTESAAPRSIGLSVEEEATEEQINQTIDQKIAAARARLGPTQCLFCSESSMSLDANLTHMSIAHSFFIPDAEYLVDILGLITYLGEKIAVGNVCIFCNGRGREFRTLDAVRKHMVDKGHCKIAYDSGEDRLEVSDFYDFTSSYPDATQKTKKKSADGTENEWEDVDESDEDADGEVDEVVEEGVSDGSDDDSDEVPDNQITYGDSHFELVLPSGARIGHRSMRRYYAQSFPRAYRGGKPEDPNSGAALVRRLLADKNSALVPRKGGFGAFGAGTDVVKARNRGEAREAGRHVREFRDQARREAFKTKIGFINNHQKHFRDPLLQ
ncbi:Cytoplasmic 60S subunit biogenesis factor [Sparassis crispa]|uniref:Cytoplasmic 60S subunit biogenesis factor n=1 Tax=Sparassis crispa TaxID=139825 RepID=A0A401GGF1_9APHY|nr:Cytoplasmic 60S subunit biogenesis factor [Sparassis crispa]GBE81264.1 Cytoplasmic 60S subunit biogenesis factor [Sparassis crispa]